MMAQRCPHCGEAVAYGHDFAHKIDCTKMVGDKRMTDFTETRSQLKKLAMAHGAETAIGRACHNLLEMTENYAKTTDFDQRVQLKANINREMARLEDLKKDISQ
jgi:hypothetical protein